MQKSRPLLPIFIRFIIISILPLLSCSILTNTPAIQLDPLTTQSDTPTFTPSPQATPSATLATIENPGSIGDAFAPELGNSGYDIQHYDLRLSLSPETPYIIESEINIQAITTHTISEIWLDFIGFDIDALSLDSKPVEFNRRNDKLIISLPSNLTVDQSFTLNIRYHGTVVRRQSRYVPFVDHLGLFYTDKNTFVASEPDGARFFFPCNDHPLDKATFAFEIIVPDGYIAVANGILTERIAPGNGQITYKWLHDYPMATYLATVAVGKYIRLDSSSPNGIPLRHYIFPENEVAFKQYLPLIGEAIDWMSATFYPYPFEVFGYTTVSGLGASLETQTTVILDSNMINQDTILHELAHMWFGDWVSLDSWGEIWRNEGFATYFQMYYPLRDDPDQFDQEMALLTASVIEHPELQPLNLITPDNLFGFESYIKGAVAVHALRQTMGDEAFFRGLQKYFKAFGGSTASDTDFRSVMEEAAGISLEGFYEDWIYK
jgi:aminopeptidase N